LREVDFNGVFSLEVCPRSTLPTYLFEKCGKALFKIAKSIIDV